MSDDDHDHGFDSDDIVDLLDVLSELPWWVVLIVFVIALGGLLYWVTAK